MLIADDDLEMLLQYGHLVTMSERHQSRDRSQSEETSSSTENVAATAMKRCTGQKLHDDDCVLHGY